MVVDCRGGPKDLVSREYGYVSKGLRIMLRGL